MVDMTQDVDNDYEYQDKTFITLLNEEMMLLRILERQKSQNTQGHSEANSIKQALRLRKLQTYRRK